MEMDTDSFTEVQHESWFSRLGSAIGGVVFGLILLAGAATLLFWNEGRSVKRYQTLDAGQKRVVSISADTVNAEHEGQLVHVSEAVTTTKPLKDTDFGLTLTALRLQRVVEMYQWIEDKETKTRKKVGGGKEKTTTYSYRREWVDRLVDHHDFKKSQGHRNPVEMPYANQQFISINAHLGAFRLTPTLVQRMKHFEDVDLDKALVAGEVPEDAKRHGAWLYFGPQPGTPAVGDVRVSFRAVYPAWISLVAQQQRNRLTPFKPAGGGELALLKTGEHSADALFEAARTSNATLTWALRLGGTLLMAIGLFLLLRPLATVADVIPLLGSLVGFGAGIAAAILTACLSLTIIAVAWIWHRPLVGALLLAGAAVPMLLLWWKRRSEASVEPAFGSIPEGSEVPPPAPGDDPTRRVPPPPPGTPDRLVPELMMPVDGPPPAPTAATGRTAATAVDHLKQGIAHFRAENLDAALTAFSTAIQKDEELGAAYYFRGVVQSRRKEKSAAVKNLQIAARLGHGKAQEALSARQITW
jgi:tetratricopeptide (TPR) repeat protein